MFELKDTVNGMTSENYKERFCAEYAQISNRLEGLQRMLNKWDNGELNFTPSCPREIYDDQMKYMINYMTVLANRAYIEHIHLH